MLPKIKSFSLKNIVIVGASGFGREVLMLLHQINQVIETWHILGFYDDNPATPASINNYPYLGNLATLQEATERVNVAIAIGNPLIKAQIRQKLTNAHLVFPVLMHPEVPNEPYQFNQIGDGTIITKGCILTTNITIGKHVLLNLGCTVGHDVEIGDYSSLMPHVNISGNSTLGQEVYVGTNATVIQFLAVGAKAIIGAGAVVHRNLPAAVTAVGVPAQVIKKHNG